MSRCGSLAVGRWERRPEFFAYWTYWLLVALALTVCASAGALVGGGPGATIGAAVYLAHEVVVVVFSWQPWRMR